jgi:hypothetical protein
VTIDEVRTYLARHPNLLLDAVRGDPALIVNILEDPEMDAVREKSVLLSFRVIGDALNLFSGLVLSSVGYATYRQLLLPFVRSLASIGLYGQRLLAHPDDALASFRKNCPTFEEPDFHETCNRKVESKSYGSVGVHVNPVRLLDLLSKYPSFTNTLYGNKYRWVVFLDGAELHKGKQFTAMSMFPSSQLHLPQSARSVFVLAAWWGTGDARTFFFLSPKIAGLASPSVDSPGLCLMCLAAVQIPRMTCMRMPTRSTACFSSSRRATTQTGVRSLASALVKWLTVLRCATSSIGYLRPGNTPPPVTLPSSPLPAS